MRTWSTAEGPSGTGDPLMSTTIVVKGRRHESIRRPKERVGRKLIGLLEVPLEDLFREYAPRARVPLSLSAPSLSANERVEAVEHGAVGPHGLQGETLGGYTHEHCMVGGPG